MPYTNTNIRRSQRRASSPRSCFHATPFFLAVALSCAGIASGAEAQSWSAARQRPPLRQIVSVDATGETTWPYGREDLASDGLAAFAADEAGTDIRSVYADADDDRLWLRAYVAAEVMPPASLVAYFFADIDDRNDTGGPAFGKAPWPPWTRDGSRGGYERAVGVRGDGTLIGVWTWENKDGLWTELTTNKDDVRVQFGRDEDPIRIGPVVHGYVQVDVLHGVSGLTRSCAGNLFVRTWHDEAAPRAFGDDDAEVFDCKPTTDAYGDPSVIRSVKCAADRDCSNDGRCRDGVCLFAYRCAGDADCQMDERCTLNACIKVVDTTCTANADCDGLVCKSGACAACSQSGAGACGAGLNCGPNGTCVDTGDFVPGAGDGGVGPGAVGPDAGIVRGGAFHCAVHGPARGLNIGTWLFALSCALLMRRRANRADRKGRA